MTKVKDRNNIIERALQSNFKNLAAPEIPGQWRNELSERIEALESVESLNEDALFVKYENRFWPVAWISFAASVFIFISLMYLSKEKDSSLKDTLSKQTYECLNMEL